mmetsp:Transcript_22082/g.46503  ORF Transcript_22082/g.46503 Transcript_22082/m.46503 type:complete len:149 (-) Transcript_22082:165-611(-)|eukprot:CAMPEP_0201121028 /NCGR_PEP_ID=MMETSP0850-20130426/4994_1 /ASSEMBLY_ACC=CAM_ASM_000622 /TAXON_ID=183588 /ORGANISM="Pseudo-nitzschia fraudulenta, Strain WWA7" /LENGTH=148 /DNA_ID=CAMNT_0047387355 /DNA_START=93 /DNA_END=539 /DNA_ORIENTATION=-
MASNNATATKEAGILVASKRVIYVGGLGDTVTPQVLRSAMIPFGDIKSLDIPMDYKVGKTRGFAFVEFDDPEDASECIFNMDMSDLCGRTIKVSLAQQNQLSKLSAQSGKGQAIWSSDQWFQEHVVGDTEEDRQKAKNAAQDKETLKD